VKYVKHEDIAVKYVKHEDIAVIELCKINGTRRILLIHLPAVHKSSSSSKGL